MRKWILIIGLVLPFSATAQISLTCPKVWITKSPEKLRAGEVVTFVANVSVENLKTDNNQAVTYSWNVNAGTIEDGQGTPSIIVMAPPDGASDNIKATVEIGLPSPCTTVVSEEIVVENRPFVCGLPPDQWSSRLKLNDEKARLQNAAYLLQRNPNTTLLFMISITSDETYSQAQKRASFIRNYLLTNHLVPLDRLQIAFRNYGYSETAVYLFSSENLGEFLKSFEATQSLEKLRPTSNFHR
jgi:hypothetical protein